MGVNDPVWEVTDVRAVVAEVQRRLVATGFLDGRDWTLNGFAEAMFAAVAAAHQAKTIPSQSAATDVARTFLVEQVQNKDLPMSERREAARLLLEATGA